MEKTRAPKPRPLTRAAGENLAYWRDARGMKLHELSARMEAVGLPLNLNSLNKIERGNRGVDLDELVALARALEVPPLLLIFALGRERTVELLPDTEVDTWAAAKWFTGEVPFPGSDEAVEESPTAYFRTQDRMIADWNQLRRKVAKARAQVGQHPGRPDLEYTRQGELDYFEDQIRSAEDQLRLHRASVRRHGVDLGELPPELAHVEQPGGSDGQR